MPAELILPPSAERARKQQKLEAFTEVAKSFLTGNAATIGAGLSPGTIQRTSWNNAGNSNLGNTAMIRRATQAFAEQQGIPIDEVNAAMVAEGMDWGAPFPPGRPFDPFFGYRRPPRTWDYSVGENVQITPRWNRISFNTIKAIWDAYDVAQVCSRHLINDVRTLDYSWQPLEGIKDDVTDDIAKARAFFESPDKQQPFRGWLHEWLMDVVRYDAGSLFIRRNEAQEAIALEIVNGTCYSDDTEVLTDSGWKLFVDVDIETDRFATRNQETHDFEWQQASSKTVAPFDGELIRFSSRTLDLCVTPNHRMLVCALPRALGGNRHRSGEVFIPAEDLAANITDRATIPVHSNWTGEHIEAFGLPATCEGYESQARSHIVNGDDFAAFMGMWLAEGSLNGDSTIMVSQKAESKGFEPYRELLTRLLGKEPYHNGASWQFKWRGLHLYLRQFGHARDKFVPDEIRNASADQLATFWHHYMLGDGSFSGERQQIITSSERMAGHLQEIAQKLGWNAGVYERAYREGSINGRPIKPTGPIYAVRVRKAATQMIRNVEHVPYDGTVYCVTVPNETLYVRRNGRPSWCGNTIMPLIDFYGRTPTDEDENKPPTGEMWSGDTVPAYQQIIQGMPWDWLTSDDVIYQPWNPLPESQYGHAPLEAVLLSANTDLRFQAHFLNFFTAGSLPAGFMEAPPDMSDPAMIQEWQDTWDAFMLGDQQKLNQIRWVPAGAKWTDVSKQKDTFAEEFPLYLMRRTCAAFGITPADLGFTENVNKSSGDTQIDVQFRVGTLPLVRHVEDVINLFVSRELKLRCRFEFDTGRETEDRVATATADGIYMDHGVIGGDEIRQKLGYPVDNSRPMPRYINNARQGPISLLSLESGSGKVDPETYAPSKDQELVSTPAAPMAGILPPQGSPEAIAAASQQAQMGRDLVAATTGKSPAGGSPAPGETTTPQSPSQLTDEDKASHGGMDPSDPKNPDVKAAHAKLDAQAKEADAGPSKPDSSAKVVNPAKASAKKATTDDEPDALKAALDVIDLLSQRLGVAKAETAGINASTGIAGIDLRGQDDDEDDEDAEVNKAMVDLALRRWRDNSRTRLRKGQRPRRFVDPNLPPELHAEVWSRLTRAQSREDVDAAFKAAADPKAPALV